MSPEKAILVVSHDPRLADVRKAILESAGFRVHAAFDLPTVSRYCHENKLDLIMIGYSLPPAEKRQIWAEVRKHLPYSYPRVA